MTEADQSRIVSLPLVFYCLAGIFLWLGCTSPSPNPDIPELISSRFAAMYPGADKVTWTGLSGGAFEVAFVYKQTEFEILFFADGGVDRTKTKSNSSVLPEKASEYAKNQLAGNPISDVMRVVDGFGAVTWEVKIGDKKYLFATNGVLIGQL